MEFHRRHGTTRTLVSLVTAPLDVMLLFRTTGDSAHTLPSVAPLGRRKTAAGSAVLVIVRPCTLSAYRPDDMPMPLDRVIRQLLIVSPLIGP